MEKITMLVVAIAAEFIRYEDMTHEEICSLSYTPEEKQADIEMRAYLQNYEDEKIEDAERARRANQECSHGGDCH